MSESRFYAPSEPIEFFDRIDRIPVFRKISRDVFFGSIVKTKL